MLHFVNFIALYQLWYTSAMQTKSYTNLFRSHSSNCVYNVHVYEFEMLWCRFIRFFIPFIFSFLSMWLCLLAIFIAKSIWKRFSHIDRARWETKPKVHVYVKELVSPHSTLKASDKIYFKAKIIGRYTKTKQSYTQKYIYIWIIYVHLKFQRCTRKIRTCICRQKGKRRWNWYNLELRFTKNRSKSCVRDEMCGRVNVSLCALCFDKTYRVWQM